MNGDGTGNVWSSGSHGGNGFSGSNNDNDSSPRSGGLYRGSFGNNNSRRGGYGFRRQGGPRPGEVHQLTDAIFIQNLPKDITRDQLYDIFSTVGPIKTDDRSGGPKIWIYKDRMTGEANGRATVTFTSDDTANKAISKYNDQHIDSIDAVVHVQLAQRRERTDGNDSGARGGYRGARSHWDNPRSRPSYSHSGNRNDGYMGGFGSDRGGDFQGMGSNSDSFQGDGGHGSSFRGNRSGNYRGASRGNGGSSNYAPY